MIYVDPATGPKALVLDQYDVLDLTAGRALFAPDSAFAVYMTPDPDWVREQIDKARWEATTLARVLAAARKRPERPPAIRWNEWMVVGPDHPAERRQ